MAILSGSRYQFSVVDYIQRQKKGVITPIVFYKFDPLDTANYTIHTYVQGETLQKLSWQYYGRPDFWWALLEYNPEITNFFSLTPGTRLRVPRV